MRASPGFGPVPNPATASRPPAPQLCQPVATQGPVAALARAEVEPGPRRARQQHEQQQRRPHRPGRRHACAAGPAPDPRPRTGSRSGPRRALDPAPRPGPRARPAPPGPLGNAAAGHTPGAGPSRDRSAPPRPAPRPGPRVARAGSHARGHVAKIPALTPPPATVVEWLHECVSVKLNSFSWGPHALAWGEGPQPRILGALFWRDAPSIPTAPGFP